MPSVYRLVDCADDADIFVVVENYKNNVSRRLPLRTILAERAVVYSEGSCLPTPILPGVYVTLNRRHYNPERTISHAYVSHLAETEGNPFCRGACDEQTQKDFRFSFIGRNCHPCRDRIFHAFSEMSSVRVRDSSQLYYHFGGRKREVSLQKSFVDVIKRSEFSLCPRGYSPASIRLYESMRLGVAPVIISDDWTAPDGPDWERFSVRVKEEDVEKIPSILAEYAAHFREMGINARKAFDEWFAAEVLAKNILTELERLSRGTARLETVRRLYRLGQKCAEDAFWDSYNALMRTKLWFKKIPKPLP